MNWADGLVRLGLGAFLVGVIIFASSMVITHERITVKGTVIDVESYDDYMEVFMDDGTSYKICYPGDNIDLTVNSHIVMRLTDWDFMFIDDGIWNDVSITKIP